ncbi:MAG TPA: sigma 54-interacting transcriptional regulator [Kofleriaceae bacterium]|nr:sigma 54-interacting transcriptional regulator [Kofleriaceae bacterium]
MLGRRPDDATLATEDLVSPGRGQRVLLVIGRSAVRAHALPERGELVLGRSRGADVVIDDRSVSRRHARLVLDGRRLAIADLGSVNGTRIDHRPISGDVVALQPGEPFHLGAVTLVIDGAIDATGRSTAISSGDQPDEGPPADVMGELDAMAGRLAAGGVSVLIQGETGVGKERMAERIHALSPRAPGPFVRLNCAAIAESLLESELFGHERGAFTGAHAAKLGLIELARGGTLFFDEVGELPLRLQVKLLRAVEERAVRRVGGVDPRPVDVRYVSATNRDLEQEVEAGRFRRDLYFRLAGATLYIPSLRERLDEILPLAERFVADAAAGLGRPAVRLSQDAHAWLVQHEWPGNVRELRSACERAVLLCEDGVLRGGHFQGPTRVRPASRSAPPPVPADDTGADNDNDSEGEGDDRASATAPGFADRASMPEAARREVEVIERRRILAALEQAGGNQTRAAALLGISRRTLVNRLGAYDLPRPRKPRL